MTGIIRFFLTNAKINYTLFVLLFLIGCISFIKIPKEIFPSMELDMIMVSGYYSGASIDMLDKISVREIENQIENIEGIDELSTNISPSRFSIVAYLQEGEDNSRIKEDIENAIGNAKKTFPPDMDEPRVISVSNNTRLLNIVMSSNKYSIDELRDRADSAKDAFFSVGGVSEVTVYGDADVVYDIVIDEKKLESYNINTSLFFKSLSFLSYLAPIGKTQGTKHYYISTNNGAKSVDELANTIIKVNNKSIRLSDVASVKRTYEESSTLSSVNGNKAINMKISYGSNANTIEIAKNIKKVAMRLSKNQEFINYKVFRDRSVVIRDRLNIVISNIIFGIIMLSIFLIVLINTRMSLLVVSGILTSFVLTVAYLYYSGYSLNMISLVGLLISLGIVVDDTIIVSENIQQKLESGMDIQKAIFEGTTQMAAPVIVASITTVVAFLPVLMMSGTMGKFIQLIPIALSAVIIASLVEVFIFLPIHAKHILNKNSKVTSWEKPINAYKKIINLAIKYKKIFLICFVIITPLLIFVGIKASKFQLFPRFDSTTLDIGIKANPNTTLEQSFLIANKIEQEILKNKEKYSIDTINAVAGIRKTLSGGREVFSYVMSIEIDFYELKPKDWFNQYIIPILSFDSDTSRQKRYDESSKIASEIGIFLKKQKFKEKYKLQELSIIRRKAGPPRTDVQIGILAQGVSNKVIINHINSLTTYLKNKKGVTSYSHSAPLGVEEIKIEINEYGQMLGVNERDIGQSLSNLYLDKNFGYVFDEKSLISLKASSSNKDDEKNLEQLQIDIGDKRVALSDVANFIKLDSFESMIKTDGKKVFYIYADVDSKIITASQILDDMKPLLQSVKKDGLDILLKGESEQNKQLMSDMLIALTIAIVLILLTLLYLFHSFMQVGIILSIIPFSILGVVMGHFIMGFNLSMPSIVGGLGLAGVVVNDGIIMMSIINKAKDVKEVIHLASTRLRPIILTTATTLLGLSTLMFFPVGQAAIFQPLAISLGFGLFWGTILNLIYVPTLYTLINERIYKTSCKTHQQAT